MPGLVAACPDRPVAGGGPVGDDRVGAVQVLVDVLDDVGDPQLREHVVARVVVDLRRCPRGAAASRRARPGRAGAAGASAGSAVQPRTTGMATGSPEPDRQRGHHPVAVVAVVLAPGDVDGAVGHPGAVQDHGLADLGARERVVGADHGVQGPRLGQGQVRRPRGRAASATRRTARPRASRPRRRTAGRAGARPRSAGRAAWARGQAYAAPPPSRSWAPCRTGSSAGGGWSLGDSNP